MIFGRFPKCSDNSTWFFWITLIWVSIPVCCSLNHHFWAEYMRKISVCSIKNHPKTDVFSIFLQVWRRHNSLRRNDQQIMAATGVHWEALGPAQHELSKCRRIRGSSYYDEVAGIVHVAFPGRRAHWRHCGWMVNISLVIGSCAFSYASSEQNVFRPRFAANDDPNSELGILTSADLRISMEIQLCPCWKKGCR